MAEASPSPPVRSPDGPPPSSCDLSTQCGHCGGPMRQEHAHYKCMQCGQRDSCCDGPY